MTKVTPMPAAASHPCGNCAFYADSVWEPIKSTSVSTLNRGFKRREFAAGQAVFEQGQDNRGVFCVSKGLFALRSLHDDGTSTLIRLAYPGSIIGFRSYLGERAHQTEARALMPSRVCTVARVTAESVVSRNAAVLARLAARCISEIDRGHGERIAMATLSTGERLADLLCRLATVYGSWEDGWLRMRLPLARPDIADLIGVRPETISRLIKKLEDSGDYRISGRDVRISPRVLPQATEERKSVIRAAQL